MIRDAIEVTRVGDVDLRSRIIHGNGENRSQHRLHSEEFHAVVGQLVAQIRGSEVEQRESEYGIVRQNLATDGDKGIVHQNAGEVQDAFYGSVGATWQPWHSFLPASPCPHASRNPGASVGICP